MTHLDMFVRMIKEQAYRIDFERVLLTQEKSIIFPSFTEISLSSKDDRILFLFNRHGRFVGIVNGS